MDKQTLQFIKEHEKSNVLELALQASRYPDIDIPFAIEQIRGRQIAIHKIPSWYANDSIVYPKHLSLEQCSSEETARYKTALCQGSTLLDLTGGLGIDFSFMAQNFNKAIYVEQNEVLCTLAQKNFEALGLTHTTVINSNAESYLNTTDKVDTIYIDPARRSDSGSKTVLIEDCSPNLAELMPVITAKCQRVIIKLSPMLDISQALKTLETINEVHVISCNNECKELLLIKGEHQKNINYHCINIQNNTTDKYTFSRDTEDTLSISYAGKIASFLYEPNSSVMKAGAFKSIAADFDIQKLHSNSHLYTSDKKVESFPGRRFVVSEVIPFGKIKKISEEIPKANITVRNFPLSVDEIRKKTKIKDGGNIFIFATTLIDESKVLIICEKI